MDTNPPQNLGGGHCESAARQFSWTPMREFRASGLRRTPFRTKRFEGSDARLKKANDPRAANSPCESLQIWLRTVRTLHMQCYRRSETCGCASGRVEILVQRRILSRAFHSSPSMHAPSGLLGQALRVGISVSEYY